MTVSSWKVEAGATAVEYAIMIAAIAAIIVGAVTLLGNNTSELFCDANREWAQNDPRIDDPGDC